MDIIQLYQDHSIIYVTEGHKHSRSGWVNIECPWCSGNPGYHLGYNLNDNFYFCWRCGSHQTIKTLSKILRLSEHETRALVKQYGISIIHAPDPKIKIRKKSFKYPSGVGPLLDNHKRYLQSRNFDPDLLIDIWQLKGSGPVSNLDNIDYKNRIIIPFLWDNQVVSFDSRSISFSATDQVRYKACPKDRELIPHKEILYGKQEAWGSTGICVEGPTDVWRFGVNSFATSGIKYTSKQIRQMAKAFKRIAVAFDDDSQALVQAARLVSELKFRGVDAFKVDIKGDPGSMEQSEANYLVKQLIH
jgi:hypothetical protein